jgi:DNA adenine methylase
MDHSELPVERTLFGDVPVVENVVNVASVPHRSPFRYPGGKTWLIPRIRQWLGSLPASPSVLVEPFAGGAIVGLTAAFEELVGRVVLVELDHDVAAAWQTIFSDENEWLAERILSFDLTEENVRAEVTAAPKTLRDQAFRIILKNRTNHGGILAPGASLLRSGENGKGLRSRWYAATLARRIRDLRAIRDRVEVVCGNGIEAITRYATAQRAVFFIDPPYTAAGKKAGTRLYRYHELDHDLLFGSTASVAGDFLMTYDNADEVVAMAKRHGFNTRMIPMKNTHHAVMSELLVGRDLGWVRCSS